jgi:hypothetical protein
MKCSFLKNSFVKRNFWLLSFALAALAISEIGASQSSSGDSEAGNAASNKKPVAMSQKAAQAQAKSNTSTSSAKKSLPEGKEAARPKSLDIDPEEVGDTKLIEQSRTNIDFSESLIDGKMNAPSGFLIQGRLSQDLTRMVRLRTSFKPEMLKSTGIPDQEK